MGCGLSSMKQGDALGPPHARSPSRAPTPPHKPTASTSEYANRLRGLEPVIIVVPFLADSTDGIVHVDHVAGIQEVLPSSSTRRSRAPRQTVPVPRYEPSSMSVTIQCASVKPEAYLASGGRKPVERLAQLFTTSTSKKAERSRYESVDDVPSPSRSGPYEERCLRAEMQGSSSSTCIVACGNGLVHTLQEAYNNHLHVVLRPDDVWITILTQFSLYINKNADDLRTKFVSHEGKKELEICGVGNIDSADFGGMAKDMGRLLQENVTDPDLRAWMVPDFSTTTPNDTTVASVIMMATLQKYFDYKFTLMCGIPSVTLLGSQDDWRAIRHRVEKFVEFGEEPTKWAPMLRTVCDAFVNCFDSSQLDQSRDFFSRVCHYSGGGSGPRYISGWAAVFSVWNEKGDWQGTASRYARETLSREELKSLGSWPIIDSQDIAPACAEVPVLLDDNGTQYRTLMLAGLPGIRIEENDRGESVLSPASGWAIFKVPES